MGQNTQNIHSLPLRDKIEASSCLHNIFSDIGQIIHPNQITALRMPAAAVAIGVQSFAPITATVIAAITDGIDWIDGAVARAANKTTMEGARFDPLVDKIVNTGELVYLICTTRHLVFTSCALLNIAIDTYSQKKRGDILEQLKEGVDAVRYPEKCTPDSQKSRHLKANHFGKYKKMLQSMAILMAFADGQNESVLLASAILLGISFALGLKGVEKRLELIEQHAERGKPLP